MYQFQSTIHPLNSNAPMHAPVTFSSPLVKWILQLDLLFLTSVCLPHSQLWVTVIKENPQSFKVTHWAILINPKVIWKFTITRLCWAVDMVYYILNAPLKILMGFCAKLFRVLNTFLSSLTILLSYSWSLLQCTMILAETVHMPLDSSIQHLSPSNCIFITDIYHTLRLRFTLQSS